HLGRRRPDLPRAAGARHGGAVAECRGLPLDPEREAVLLRGASRGSRAAHRGVPHELGGRPEIHLGSGPDARVERSVTRARRMSRPAKAGATDEVRPAPPTPLWRCLSSTPKAGGFTAAAASADRAMRAGRVPRMPRWLRQPRHGSRAWYCPFTLASGSDPRHESRVALLKYIDDADGLLALRTDGEEHDRCADERGEPVDVAAC